MDSTTICGTDLHILKGDVPAVTDGRILGHEGIGTITEIGAAVRTSRSVTASSSPASARAACAYCRQRLYSHCQPRAAGIGWILGHLIDGTQAEYVRVPFAENSLYKVPAGVTDDEGF